MFRLSCHRLRVSPFSIYMRDLGRQGKLAGVKKPATVASASYKKLSPSEQKALQKRASQVSYPALDAYNRFQKEFSHRFVHLSNRQRQRKVSALWAELKEKGTVRIPQVPKKGSASKKVKAAAKARKSTSK